MPRKPEVSEHELLEIAKYLALPKAGTEIHAELPPQARIEFEREYAKATNNYPLPQNSSENPYYVWSEDSPVPQ